MPKMKNNKKNKKDTKYNADNEIIIGVTTKPKEKVRVEKKKATRTNVKSSKNKKTTNNNVKRVTSNKNRKINSNVKTNQNDLSKEKQIRKLNKKKIIGSIAIVLFLAICGTIYYLTTPVFNVANIDVYGNAKNSVDTYISLSGININQTNIFGFTNSSVIKKIKENPYVQEVRIERKLPNILKLYITERTVDYQINYLNSYVYLNNQGYILEINEEEQDVLTIDGLTSLSDNIQAGQRLSNEDLIKLDTILKVTNYLKYNSVESKLTKIDANDDENYILEFAEDGKKAYIGDSSSITEKMTAVSKVLEAEKGKKGKIYADEEALKRNRVYFREENKED